MEAFLGAFAAAAVIGGLVLGLVPYALVAHLRTMRAEERRRAGAMVIGPTETEARDIAYLNPEAQA